MVWYGEEGVVVISSKVLPTFLCAFYQLLTDI